MLVCVLHEMESIRLHNVTAVIFCEVPVEKTDISIVTQNCRAEKKADSELCLRISPNNKLL
jgi:hypothetical protein